MTHIDRIRDVEGMLGNLPARWGDTSATGAVTKIVISGNDPGGNYPTFSNMSQNIVYWGLNTSSPAAFTSVGPQGFSPTPSSGGQYFLNQGSQYIAGGTPVLITKAGSNWFARESDAQLYTGTAAQYITPISPLTWGSPQVNLVAPGGNMTMVVFNNNQCVIPLNFPLQVINANGVLNILSPSCPTIPATLNSNVSGGTAQCTPLSPYSIGQVTCYDATGSVGGVSGNPCTISYTGGIAGFPNYWLLVSSKGCT